MTGSKSPHRNTKATTSHDTADHDHRRPVQHPLYLATFYGTDAGDNARIGCGSGCFTLKNDSGQSLDVQVIPSAAGQTDCPTTVTDLPTIRDPDDGSTGYMYFGLSSDQDQVDIQVRPTGQGSYQSVYSNVSGANNQSFPVAVSHWCERCHAQIEGGQVTLSATSVVCSAGTIQVLNSGATRSGDIVGLLDGAGASFGPAAPGGKFEITDANSNQALASASSVTVGISGGSGSSPAVAIYHADGSAVAVDYDSSANAQPNPQLITADDNGTITISNTSSIYLLGIYDESWNLQVVVLQNGATSPQPPLPAGVSWLTSPATLSVSATLWIHIETYQPDQSTVARLEQRLAQIYALGPVQINGYEILGDPVVIVKQTGCEG
jgi:hypothetical protein